MQEVERNVGHGDAFVMLDHSSQPLTEAVVERVVQRRLTLISAGTTTVKVRSGRWAWSASGKLTIGPTTAG